MGESIFQTEKPARHRARQVGRSGGRSWRKGKKDPVMESLGLEGKCIRRMPGDQQERVHKASVTASWGPLN